MMNHCYGLIYMLGYHAFIRYIVDIVKEVEVVSPVVVRDT